MSELLIVVILAGLLAFRAARAVAMDDAGRPIRDWTVRFKAGKPKSKPRTWLVGLVQCPHCIGFWLALIGGLVCSAILLDVDWPVDLIIAGATAGLESLLATYAQANKIELTVEEPIEVDQPGE